MGGLLRLWWLRHARELIQIQATLCGNPLKTRPMGCNSDVCTYYYQTQTHKRLAVALQSTIGGVSGVEPSSSFSADTLGNLHFSVPMADGCVEVTIGDFIWAKIIALKAFASCRADQDIADELCTGNGSHLRYLPMYVCTLPGGK